jgi:hypothetical protein
LTNDSCSRGLAFTVALRNIQGANRSVARFEGRALTLAELSTTILVAGKAHAPKESTVT